ncbi:VWA domain-containing protein [Lentzea sp. NPDC058450]|uniref:VWA domain-containing protein n=1 Tax=Lentzea sp. NPDC058450 TaxID=3346505 RepID=UPI003651A003
MAPSAVTAPAGQAEPAPCGKVEVVTFRGSGEDGVDDAGRSNGLSGATLQKIIDKARALPSPTGYTLADVTVYGVPYPAIPLAEYNDEDQDLFDSVEYGRLFGNAYLQKRREECESVGTRFVLAGYSQGVIAAREVAQDVPAGWIAGVFGLGDPAQKPNARGVTGGGANGNGMYRELIKKEDGTAGSDSFYDLLVPSFLFCHDDDPVCDLTFKAQWPPVDIGPHTNYGGTDAELTDLAAKLRGMAEDATTAPAPPDGTGTGPADLMFAIDTTGSMTPYLSAAVASAKSTADAMHAASSKARVGLVEYRDHGDAYVARVVVPLTEDFDAFDAGLRALSANGGGDTPEAVYSGLVTALGADWDRSATRALIVLGDAPAHDPEPVTGLTAAAVTEIAKGIAPMPDLPPTVGTARVAAEPDAPGQERTEKAEEAAPAARLAAAPGEKIPAVPVYALSAHDDLSTQMGPITTATGGATFPIGSPDEVTKSVVRAVEDASTAPTARLKAAGTVLAGNKTTLSGLASSHAGDATFAFDFDNDGTIDQTGQEAAVAHTYPNTGGVKARLVVTDDRGRSSEAVVDIDVRALDSLHFDVQAPTTGPSTPQSPTPGPSSSPAPVPAPNPPSTGGLALTGTTGLVTYLGLGCVLLGCGVLLFVTAKRRRRAAPRP